MIQEKTFMCSFGGEFLHGRTLFPEFMTRGLKMVVLNGKSF
jgi:hypothetical protein